MCFSEVNLGANIDLTILEESDFVKVLLNENIGLVLQADSEIEQSFANSGIELYKIGEIAEGNTLIIKNNSDKIELNISDLRDTWFKTSYLLDRKQSKNGMAEERFANYKNQPLVYNFPTHFTGKLPLPKRQLSEKKAVIRSVKWQMPCIWQVLM
ncbi:MAG: phosphoribosylformylglycinamidine synthase, partial [Spirosomaceae bacterium]|nr:phosphoribosylformylglycinamidine synthase [Spirosomataceae bacterium]